MGRPKKSAPVPIEPEFESQEIPEEEPEVEEEGDEPEPSPTTNGTMSKAAVCRALLAEGITENEDALAAAKSRFGVEIKATDFTLYKSKEKARQGAAAQKAKPRRKPKAAAPLVNGYVAPPEKPRSAAEPDMLLALENVKELVSQFGAEKLKRMVDLIG